MKRYKLEFILEDRIKEDSNDFEIPNLSHSRLLDIIFSMLQAFPFGLRIAKGTMSIREIKEGRLGQQILRK